MKKFLFILILFIVSFTTACVVNTTDDFDFMQSMYVCETTEVTMSFSTKSVDTTVFIDETTSFTAPSSITTQISMVTDATTANVISTKTENVTSTIATTSIPSPNSSIINISQEKNEYTFDGECTQGMCINDKYIFVSFSLYNGNTYRIRKINRETGQIVAESDEYFNHANGMAYNPHTNELAICALNGFSSLTESSGIEDYSFYICDADTLELKTSVSVYDAVVSVSPESCGISGITYDVELQKYLVLTRYPERYIIYLNDDLTFCNYFYIGEYDSSNGLYGDITTDSTYVYICRWLSAKDPLLNIVDVYTVNGELVYQYTVYGITHIESLAIQDGRCYVNFIDFSSGVDTQGYSFELIH